MSQAKKLLLLVTFATLVSVSLQGQETCPKFHCKGDFKNADCATKTITSDVVSYEVKPCDKAYCPYTTLAGGDATPAQCKNFQPSKNNYGGYECTEDNQCVNGCNQEKKVCKGAAETEECKIHSDCNVGLVCLEHEGKNTCSKPLQAGAACRTSYDCINSHGCNLKTHLCTEYFSVKSGEQASADEDNRISFCATGDVIDGVCRDLVVSSTLADNGCNTEADCKYSYNDSQGKTVAYNWADSCECGYSENGGKTCKLPQAEPTFDFDSFKRALKTSLLSSNCHSEERFNCEYTRLKENYKFDNLQNTRADVLAKNKLSMVEECVKKAVFPFYNSEKGVCPKFQCVAPESANGCGNVADAKLDADRKVELSACKSTQECKFKSSAFFQLGLYSPQCVDTPTSVGSALPGETCKVKEDCQAVLGDKSTCVDGVCFGAKKGEACENTTQCVAGLYCDSTAKTCADFVAADGACLSTYDCNHNNVCLGEKGAKKCVAFKSQSLGADVSEVQAEFMNAACKSGYSYGGFCAEIRYSEGTKSENGWVSCIMGDFQTYEIKTDAEAKTLTSEYCRCGYNADGKGFFPLSRHDDDTAKLFERVHKSFEDIVSSSMKLHSMHRLQGDAATLKGSACSGYSVNPLYKGAVNCAVQVLGKYDCSEPAPPSPSPSGSSSSSSSASNINLAFSVVVLAFLAIFA